MHPPGLIPNSGRTGTQPPAPDGSLGRDRRSPALKGWAGRGGAVILLRPAGVGAHTPARGGLSLPTFNPGTLSPALASGLRGHRQAFNRILCSVDGSPCGWNEGPVLSDEISNAVWMPSLTSPTPSPVPSSPSRYPPPIQAWLGPQGFPQGQQASREFNFNA